ncbi:MAG: RNA-binding protein [Acidobacteria bacterium]|nr:RNA-binding protein [Acidobacteriota bacterium]
MPVRLFVGNLPYDTTEPDLREFFAPVGPLSTVIIPVDRETGKRRGFAFVEFSDPAHAEEASRTLNNRPFKGRNITINEARARENRSDSGPRSGNPMRPAGMTAPRPGFNPRPSVARPAQQGSDFSGNPMETGRTSRTESRRRSFGADAKPARKRKSNYGPKTEMGYRKGPIRERVGGQVFGGLEDDLYEDDDYDYLADFRDRTDEEEGAV